MFGIIICIEKCIFALFDVNVCAKFALSIKGKSAKLNRLLHIFGCGKMQLLHIFLTHCFVGANNTTKNHLVGASN